MARPTTLKERVLAAARKAAKEREARAAKAAARPAAAYRLSIVTFIDILGFREIVKIKPAEEIAAILALLRDWSSGDEDIGDEYEDWPAGYARSIAFSDNVVRVCPIDGEEGGQGALFNELLNLVHIQAKLTERGIFLRGGLTVENIYLASGVVYGPGLVRAYELESQFAVYPRIVVDPAVMEQYFANPVMRGDHSLQVDLSYVGNMLREADDGLFFVDYLKACRSELNDPVAGFTPLLKEHAAFITKAAAALAQFTIAKQKYGWLAHYHNLVVDETGDADDDCKVDEVAVMFPSLAESAKLPADKPNRTAKPVKLKASAKPEAATPRKSKPA